MSWDGASFGSRGPSLRARRLLVRVLGALRREGRGAADERRVEELADRIMLALPRQLLPIGALSCAVLAICCLMPLLHDMLPATGFVGAPAPAADVVESGLRAQGSVMNDGLETLRAAVAPFAASAVEGYGSEGSVGSDGIDAVGDDSATAAPTSVIASAPYKKS